VSSFGILCDRSHGTGPLAFQTFVAIFIHSTFEKPKRRDQAEKSSQWAEIAAPKTWDETIEDNDPSKDQEGDGRHIIDRLKIVEVR